jgi:hypothetical protein
MLVQDVFLSTHCDGYGCGHYEQLAIPLTAALGRNTIPSIHIYKYVQICAYIKTYMACV